MPIAVDVDRRGDEVVVRVSGEVDLRTSPDLRAAVDGALDEGARHLAVDLAGVDFLDSTGLSVLVGAHKRLAREGSRLVVANAPPPVVRVLSITGLDRVFDLRGADG